MMELICWLLGHKVEWDLVAHQKRCARCSWWTGLTEEQVQCARDWEFLSDDQWRPDQIEAILTRRQERIEA